MKVYIAGKIIGDPDYRAKFKRAEDALREEGHTVINPAVLPAGLDPADYGRICFAMLDSADAVAFLGDFGESRGAKVEYDYCKYTKKKIMYLQEKDERVCTFKPGVYKRLAETSASNADHIRAMSDDELAKWLCGISTTECCDLLCPGRYICERGNNGLAEWLRMPYKTED